MPRLLEYQENDLISLIALDDLIALDLISVISLRKGLHSIERNIFALQNKVNFLSQFLEQARGNF